MSRATKTERKKLDDTKVFNALPLLHAPPRDHRVHPHALPQELALHRLGNPLLRSDDACARARDAMGSTGLKAAPYYPSPGT